jgi:hypothetical protein
MLVVGCIRNKIELIGKLFKKKKNLVKRKNKAFVVLQG